MSLVARHLEEAGIPTVIMGSALDIIEHCVVPRFLYSDFPLGNPCGKPYDEAMQQDLIERALHLLYQAEQAGSIVRTPYRWAEDESWRELFCKVDETNAAALRAKGEQRRQAQLTAKASGEARAPMIDQQSSD